MPDTNLSATLTASLAPRRRGPLDGAAAIVADGVRATPLPPMRRWLLRGDPGVLTVPRDACHSARVGDADALWLGPDEWLLLAAEGALPRPPPDPARGVLVDVSHRQGAIRIEGPRAAELLLAGCPQDLEAAPVGYCSRTVLGKSEVVLWRRSADAWHLEAWRSFLPYVWAFLDETAPAAASGLTGAVANRYYQGPRSDHFDGERFFNPGAPVTDKSLLELAKWRLGGRPAHWPASVPVRQTVPDAHVAGLRVTHVGHATVLIQVAGVNILTDPVWSDRASPFRIAGPKRVTAPGIAFDALPPIHAVLLSHNHYDHMDTATLARLHAAHDPLLVLPLGNDAIVRQAVPGMRIAPGDWGDTVPLAPGVDTVLVPANHWSARWLADRRMALWCGFVIRTPVGAVYFAGDTAYVDGVIFRRIAAEYGPPDLALVPIGAYAPRWFMRPQHIDPEEAVRIVGDLDAKQALGTHWGTFQLTDEAREEPPARFLAAAEAAGLATQCAVADPGGRYEIR